MEEPQLPSEEPQLPSCRPWGPGVTTPLCWVISLAVEQFTHKVAKTGHQGGTQSLSLKLTKLVRAALHSLMWLPPGALGAPHRCPGLQQSGLAGVGSAENGRNKGGLALLVEESAFSRTVASLACECHRAMRGWRLGSRQGSGCVLALLPWPGGADRLGTLGRR